MKAGGDGGRTSSRLLHRARERGYTLVELMISGVVGLFIVLGLSVVFINMRTAFGIQNDIAELQDNEHMSVSLIKSGIELAGFYPDPLNSSAIASFPVATGGLAEFVAGQSISASTGTNGDMVTVRFINPVGSGLLNCLGQTNNTGAAVLVTQSFMVDANRRLVCSIDNGTTWVPLTGSIVSMAALYGFDADSNGSVDRYGTAAEVSTADMWPRVRSVRLSLSMANPFATTQGGSTGPLVWRQVIALMNGSV